jgi:hypothetical protein
MRERCSLEKPAIQSNNIVPPFPCQVRLSNVAIPKIVKVARAGIAGDKFKNGPNSTDRVMRNIDMANTLMAVWFIISTLEFYG